MEETLWAALRAILVPAQLDALQGRFTVVCDASAPLVRFTFLAPDGGRAFWVGYRCFTQLKGMVRWYVNGLCVPEKWVSPLVMAAYVAWCEGLLS